ncbi:MFS transporter [Sabulicella glaciei]|uniref:MFS transporter n=1 Tax=Sabulicella glaciei TaxID=2984948 RepID=A0ABT3NUL6_9PROT|nr:MFS transporter [Roseococcus sp. MDT2-1-1]MCW8085851.1 MFS transporter [Roseococcus sp. MDT2-1-1]
MPGKARSLALLLLGITLSLAVWFAGTAAVPALLAAGAVTRGEAGWLVAAVQGGFVAGTLVSAVLAAADRFPARALFLGSATLAGLATMMQALVEPAGTGAYALRFLAGTCVAGIYPVGMKLASGWARGDIGLLIGLVVGAVTLGSAAPHAVPALLGTPEWHVVYLAAGAASLLGGLCILPFREGPLVVRRPPFDPRQALEAWRDRRLRLANLGYLGHMWELYAMWAWVGLFLLARGAGEEAGLLTALVVGSGALGCVGLGLLADRFNRARVAAAAMLVSGGCAIAIGFAPDWLVWPLAAVWGVSVVADSAQFSACTTLCARPDLVGTMLTVQTAMGFLLTVPAIQLMAWAVPALGWGPSFALLGVGPLLGAWAMWRLAPLLPRAL